MSDRRLSTVSLFTGAGGLDVGLEHAGGFELLACLELEPQFCDTLRLNREERRFGSRETLITEADLHTYDPFELMDQLGLKPGDLDVLVGGPLGDRHAKRSARLDDEARYRIPGGS